MIPFRLSVLLLAGLLLADGNMFAVKPPPPPPRRPVYVSRPANNNRRPVTGTVNRNSGASRQPQRIQRQRPQSSVRKPMPRVSGVNRARITTPRFSRPKPPIIAKLAPAQRTMVRNRLVERTGTAECSGVQGKAVAATASLADCRLAEAEACE